MIVPNFNIGDYVYYIGENDQRHLTKGSIYKIELRSLPKVFSSVVTEYVTYNDSGFLKPFEYYEIIKFNGNKNLKSLVSLVMGNLERFLKTNLTFPTEIILPSRVLKQHHELTTQDLVFNGVPVITEDNEDNVCKMVYYLNNDKMSMVVVYTENFNIDKE